MDINDLFLRKAELPIINNTCFEVPIHPRLLDPNFTIDPRIANEVFPQVAVEWYDDLQRDVVHLENPEVREWIKRVFLKRKPKVRFAYGEQTLDTLSWRDDVSTAPNGFANGLSISRNAGGTLHYDPQMRAHIRLGKPGYYIRFSDEKAREFRIAERAHDSSTIVTLPIYSQHNIDHYPGALFLRNWAIAYMNEVFRRHFPSQA